MARVAGSDHFQGSVDFTYVLSGLPRDVDTTGICFRTDFFEIAMRVVGVMPTSDTVTISSVFLRQDADPGFPYTCGTEFVSYNIHADGGFAPYIAGLLRERFIQVGATVADYVCPDGGNDAKCVFMAFKNHSN